MVLKELYKDCSQSKDIEQYALPPSSGLEELARDLGINKCIKDELKLQSKLNLFKTKFNQEVYTMGAMEKLCGENMLIFRPMHNFTKTNPFKVEVLKKIKEFMDKQDLNGEYSIDDKFFVLTHYSNTNKRFDDYMIFYVDRERDVTYTDAKGNSETILTLVHDNRLKVNTLNTLISMLHSSSSIDDDTIAPLYRVFIWLTLTVLAMGILWNSGRLPVTLITLGVWSVMTYVLINLTKYEKRYLWRS